MKRTQTTPTKTGLTPTQKRRRRRVQHKETRVKSSFSLSQLDFEKTSIIRLKEICRDNRINDKANAKIVLIARMMDHFRDHSRIELFDTHDIANICHTLGLSSYGTREEKIQRCIDHISKNEQEDRSQYEKDDTLVEPSVLDLSQELGHLDLETDAELPEDESTMLLTENHCNGDSGRTESIDGQNIQQIVVEDTTVFGGEELQEEEEMTDAQTVFRTIPKVLFLEKRKLRMEPTETSGTWANTDFGSEFIFVARCHVCYIESKLQEIPFFQTIIGSHELKMNESSKVVNEPILREHNYKLLNVRLKKRFPYSNNPDLPGKSILFYETVFCKHPLCLESKGSFLKRVGKVKYLTNCSAKGKIVIYNDDTSQAFIYAKGQHDSTFIPSIDPRRITPDKREQVVEAYNTLKPTVKRLSHATGLSRKQVTSIIQYEKKSKQLASDPFLSFKLRLAKLNGTKDIVVLVPSGMTLMDMNETNYVVLVLNEKLVDIGLNSGKGKLIQGIDSVFKITSFHSPINVIATIDDNFKGVIQAISIAHDNSHQTLMQILDTFLQYNKRKDPNFRPQWMMDAAKANLSAMRRLSLPYTLCRFHISERWKKHLSKLPSQVQKELAKHLVYMGISKDSETYLKYYGQFQKYCKKQDEKTKNFLQYFNQKYHSCHESWTAESRLLDMNSIGNTNNICESQIRLLEETASSRVIQRLDYVIDPVVERLQENYETLGDITLPAPKTVQEFNKRLEKGIVYHNSGYVRKFIGAEYVYRIQKPDSDDIHYCDIRGMFCNCLDYVNNFGRVCKHLNAAMVTFAVENGVRDVERDGFKFLQVIKDIVNKKDSAPSSVEVLNCTNRVQNLVGAPVASRKPSRKFPLRKKTGPKKKQNVLEVDSTNQVSIENVLGVKKNSAGNPVFLVTVNGSNIWEEQQYIRESDLLEEFLEELIELYSTLRQRSENDHVVIEEVRYIDDGYKLRVRGNDSFTRITKEHKVPLFYYLAQFTNVDVQ